MKAKISRGDGFRGVMQYIFQDGKEAEVVGGNMVGQDAKSLTVEFSTVGKLRPDCKSAVWHVAIALPTGEKLEAEKWGEMARRYIELMEFSDKAPYTAERHSDTDHDHIHIVASRIGLDSKLWHGKNDVFKSIDVCQQLEKEFGLTLTPGLERDENGKRVRKERTVLTKGELEMAIRTETMPPRMLIQDAVDQVLQQPCTAVEFMHQLARLDVRAIPNIASTGKMNGVSFESKGVYFAGSKIGDSYKWSSLEKRGVSYEQTRDCQELTDARRFASERAEREQGSGVGSPAIAASTDRSVENAVGAFKSAGSDHRAIIATGDIGPGSGQDFGNSAKQHRAANKASRTPDHGSGAKRVEAVDSRIADGRGEIGDRDEQLGLSDHRGADTDRSTFEAAKADQQSQGRSGDSKSRVGFRDADTPTDVDLHDRDGASDWISHASDSKIPWSLKFKQKSASLVKRTVSVRQELIQEARFISPIPYLQQYGYEVKKEGVDYLVLLGGDYFYRLFKSEEKWLWHGRYGVDGVCGDNIDLVNEIKPGTKFSEAVFQLTGASELSPSVIHEVAKAPNLGRFPTVPAVSDQEYGWAFLNKCGIDDATIAAAEKFGFLTFSQRAVCFLGCDDEGRVRSATMHCTDTSETVQKRDLVGSNKTYSPILPGDSDVVVIVEDGVDALSLHSMSRHLKKSSPTVIVSGGAGIISFLRDNKNIQSILKLARKIIISPDGENNESILFDKDAEYAKQKALIEQIGAVSPLLYRPDSFLGKNFSEQNLRMVQALATEEKTAWQKFSLRQ